MDYRKLSQNLQRRPGMSGLDGSFGQFCAFLTGVDAGHDWQSLTGFRQLLVTRAGVGNNLTWTGLVVRLAFPDTDACQHELWGAENLGDEAIFVNHAPGAIAPLDPELIEIGDAVGQLP